MRACDAEDSFGARVCVGVEGAGARAALLVMVRTHGAIPRRRDELRARRPIRDHAHAPPVPLVPVPTAPTDRIVLCMPTRARCAAADIRAMPPPYDPHANAPAEDVPAEALRRAHIPRADGPVPRARVEQLQAAPTAAALESAVRTTVWPRRTREVCSARWGTRVLGCAGERYEKLRKPISAFARAGGRNDEACRDITRDGVRRSVSCIQHRRGTG